MDLCSRGHDEVCYEASNCPACEYAEEVRGEAQKEIDALNEEIEALQKETP